MVKGWRNGGKGRKREEKGGTQWEGAKGKKRWPGEKKINIAIQMYTFHAFLPYNMVQGMKSLKH